MKKFDSHLDVVVPFRATEANAGMQFHDFHTWKNKVGVCERHNPPAVISAECLHWLSCVACFCFHEKVDNGRIVSFFFS